MCLGRSVVYSIFFVSSHTSRHSSWAEQILRLKPEAAFITYRSQAKLSLADFLYIRGRVRLLLF